MAVGDPVSTSTRPSIDKAASSSLSATPSSVATNIKVIARFRPHNADELAADSSATSIAEFLSQDSVFIESKDFSGSFTYDRVFDMNSSQLDVFNYSLKQTVDDLLNGYNGTVFAYGQTGSGKSYTMMGPNNSIDDSELRGAIPRIVDRIFDLIIESSEDIEYTVKVSYMEIYMERIRDLLNPTSDNLPIHEDKTRGVYVKGLVEEYVSSADEVYEVMRQGSAVRAVASTNMNQESSRSHSIFVITVAQKNTLTGAQKTGQLSLVDLAGSEKVGKTGASGQTLEEAKKINKSLSALGMVINSLTDGKSTHIPYRDSKLTRILQESLGGNSRTSLIVNCSPSTYNDAETLSTLRFGVRAKSIKNKAKINTELSPLELRQLLRKCQAQLEAQFLYTSKLEEELTNWRAGDSPPKESWIPFEKPALQPQVTNSRGSSARSSLVSVRSVPSSRPSTPSQRGNTKQTPSGQKQRLSDPKSLNKRADTDIVEEYMRRENELQDQLSEKESIISEQEQLLVSLRQQIKDEEENEEEELATTAANLELAKLNADLNLQIDNLNYEKKELSITSGSLSDENTRLTAELQEAKQKLIEYELSQKSQSNSLRVVENVENFQNIDDNGIALKSPLSSGDKENIGPTSPGNEKLTPAELHEKKKQKKMSEILGQFYQVPGSSSTSLNILDGSGSIPASPSIPDIGLLRPDSKEFNKYLDSLIEKQHSKFEEYVKSISGDGGNKVDLDQVYGARIKASEETTRELLAEISNLKYDQSKKPEDEKIDVLVSTIKEKEAATIQAQEQIEAMQTNIAQYETLKSSLMRDLQERCERVVELEISLDAAREQYNLAIRNSNTKQQQKKMALLQRNLEQLTSVQRQLVEQNVGLKRDVAMAQKILEARNDRIQDLENALRESQSRLGQESELFESQLTYLRDRLIEVKRSGSPPLSLPNQAGVASDPFLSTRIIKSSTAGPIPTTPSYGPNNRVIHYPDLSPTKVRDRSGSGSTIGGTRVVSGGAHTKIVKPLRGGGGNSNGSGSNGSGTGSSPQTPIKLKADSMAKSVTGLWTKLNNSIATGSSGLVAAAKTSLGSPKKTGGRGILGGDLSSNGGSSNGSNSGDEDVEEVHLDPKEAKERELEGTLLSGSTAYQPEMSE
ncbi:uncharacterized protein SAPINGB_P001377 [Magnusiomyces paraingens]|uniref:Kinesin motor domain-containing protein n=1 Tax=Magnusiomyces paraingens TaxID=2606893 RepID=A0A5E8B5X7_9ASCO|nr:uncharacterized protein SAPINGB_P001377 [Saprochaete ingens]VVT46768.1 unnamed protein product [Saprochaete ingens]